MQEDVLIKKYFYNLNYIVLCEMYLNEYLKPDVIEEKDLTSQSLKEAIDSMLSNPAKLIQIEENAKNMAITDARERIADIIISLAK